MSLFRRSRDSASKPPSDGPEQWAARAREVDAEEKRRRMAEPVGDTAVANPYETAEQHEQRNTFTNVGELSEEFLRHLNDMRATEGKFVRIGDKIFVSPGARPGFAERGLHHKEILERAMRKKGTEERVIGAEALQGASEETIGPSGLVDAGKFDIYFLGDGEEPNPDGTRGRFRIFGLSASFGMAEPESRQKTADIAAQKLGPHIRVDNNLHKF